jgi:hypothetical protein
MGFVQGVQVFAPQDRGNECCAGYDDFLFPVFPGLTFVNPIVKQSVQFFNIRFRNVLMFGQLVKQVISF